MDTTSTRTAIGFPAERPNWNEAEAQFDEHSLRIFGHPVMEDWEATYMTILARIATANGGKVLEIGYGLGISAHAIQAADIKAHYIIECHPDVGTRCLADCRDGIVKGALHLMTGFWQDLTPLISDESFDGILFDTYPLSEDEIHQNHFAFFSEAYRMLRPGGIFTYYSDEEDSFSPMHYSKIVEAGFDPESISHEICKVSPPPRMRVLAAPNDYSPNHSQMKNRHHGQ